jgi:hypothetical protein
MAPYTVCPQSSISLQGSGIACAGAGDGGRVVRNYVRWYGRLCSLPQQGGFDDCAVWCECGIFVVGLGVKKKWVRLLGGWLHFLDVSFQLGD